MNVVSCEKLFTEEQKRIQQYVENSSLLEQEISLLTKNDDLFPVPSPDLFHHRMTYYQGFARYPQRLKNYLIAQKSTESGKRFFFPVIMDIEPNTTCTYKCTMCRVSEWGSGGRCEDMPWVVFEDFINKYPYLCEVKLHGMGEPLLHPDYFKMVRHLVEKSIWVRTSTNGSLLHIDNNYKRLIDTGIGEVQVSIDGATKQIYERIRINGNFEKVVRNVTLLNEYANKQKRLYTRMWVLLQKTNRHQLFDFVRQAARMKFRRLSFSCSMNDWGDKEWRRKNGANSINEDIAEEEGLQLKMLGVAEGVEITFWKQSASYEWGKKLCPWPFTRPYISADMRVLPCCMLAATPSVMDLGSAKEFSKIWNDEKYQIFRANHLNGNIPRDCANCYKKDFSSLKREFSDKYQ